MAQIQELNAHERPPEAIRQRYKTYQKITLADIDEDHGIIDLRTLNPEDLPDSVSLSHWVSSDGLQFAFEQFAGDQKYNLPENLPVFTHKLVSGLQLIPSILPPAIQIELLSRLLHRDLSNNEHQTNLHLHYDITYPDQASSTHQPDLAPAENGQRASQSVSFFEDDPSRVLYPKDPQVHRPLTVQQILTKRLRWVTLGGQYDWTAKVYPPGCPPSFPNDVASLLRAVFPQTKAEAAILNVYSPGDTLSPHRDVSEECDIGLISISFGCEGLFLISHDDGSGCEIIRLRSGDAVYMDGTSRFAWHAVPKIVPGTCPEWLADWPSVSSKGSDVTRYDKWKRWMAGKRVNLNVRQMSATGPHG
ncbi:oxidoreductase, 2OG-Fe(II) oxygenase family [Aspergillus clavatus NRRL 1]|uniref:mRNA N(6)-methyladenine demethylase n=1 Tax=Aspergillus clavatus (strain ATCC 1007 / CBS 513.65 / DSM 816 / NCTC 3887 / NRRL 1 / QM 1276 / 107) TaxID=344612 RepID=A1CTD6_ASPCL|nr:oxidoreductase, 2OG-Fe(II) oxygenase family [Aspergillus clavatus NRRL 1]EAW06573.1 oxidoreductase, 2OG-Fe(II) oxygenase family family [Aspergillus clavatus NRRL 1]